MGAALHVVRRRERRARTPRRVLGVRRPPGRPGQRGRPHPRLRPLPPGRRAGGPTAAELLAEVDPSLPGRVASYRGGYLPEERREIEQALRDGRLLGLAATNALEMGIDVAGLDAVIVAGFPGTRAAWWQQVGRAGRNAGDALAVLVARDDPLDTYLVTHPEALLDQAVEQTVFDPENPYVLGPHLCAAAQEVPLREDELRAVRPRRPRPLDELTASGRLRRRPQGGTGPTAEPPTPSPTSAPAVAARSAGRGLDRTGGRHRRRRPPHSTAHAGAVYVHRGETWLVDSLDLDDHVAMIDRAEVDYSTTARELTAITVVAELDHRAWGEARISLGDRRGVPPGRVLPPPAPALRPGAGGGHARPARADACAPRPSGGPCPTTCSPSTASLAADLPGAAHAAEHCSIGLLPLFATCDRWDIGGVSTAHHPDTGRLTVFVYDGHAGGAGISAVASPRRRAWLTATRETIASCECPDGCPSCVQSPKCGNQNHPLDKPGAVALLDVLLADAPPSSLPHDAPRAPADGRGAALGVVAALFSTSGTASFLGADLGARDDLPARPGRRPGAALGLVARPLGARRESWRHRRESRRLRELQDAREPRDAKAARRQTRHRRLTAEPTPAPAARLGGP